MNRRKLKRIRFPAVRFILLSQKRISRSYRLRHWLLLALRTLAVVFLALLLANPIFQTGAGFAGGGPVSLVILLDNSLSMTWSADGNGFNKPKRPLFSHRRAQRRRPRRLNPNQPDRQGSVSPQGRKGSPVKELERIEISDGTANISAALTKAYELLNEPAGQKEIRLITDMGLTGWDQFSTSSLKQYDPSIPLKTIRTGKQQQPLNGTLKEVRLASQGVGVNLPVRLEATAANFGVSESKMLWSSSTSTGRTKSKS